MTSTPVENGLIITSNVDLKTFNPSTFPELHKSNVATNVDYILKTKKKLRFRVVFVHFSAMF